MRRTSVPLAAGIAALLLLAGCATTTAPGSDGPGSSVDLDAIPAPGEVIGQGTLLQKDGEDAQLCLGAVAESYPPQCTGETLVGWDWGAVEGEESASGVTWGAYAVTGTWDGTAFTAESAVMLALHDPMPTVDPLTDPANAGDTPDGELLELQRQITDDAPFDTLTSWTENGYLFVQVVYDDGTVQTWVSAEYGVEMVAVRGARRDA